MANALYDRGRDSFLNGNPTIDWDTDNIKAVLVDINGGHYVVNLATHQYLASILVGDRRATSSNLAGKNPALNNGVADSDDITFTAVAAGTEIGALVFYKDTGDAATSPLIGYVHIATGLPITPNNNNITITIDNGALRLFKL